MSLQGSPSFDCQGELKKILERKKTLGADWCYSSLSDLENLCPNERAISYWKAVVLTDLFQYQKALAEISSLKTKIETLPEAHWLHLWVFIRKKELEFLQGKIQAIEYEEEVLEKSSKESLVSFLKVSLERKPSLLKMREENSSSVLYKDLQIFEENSAEETKEILRRDLDLIVSHIPLLASLLKRTTLLLASDGGQFESWLGDKQEACVLGSSPEWLEREFVIVADSKAILSNNITLLHELLHIFVRVSPRLHEVILKFRHNFGHYKNPKADSEHFFVNASQFYLSSYDSLYEEKWPEMHKLLKTVFGGSKIPARGTCEEQVLWRIREDQKNFFRQSKLF